MPRLFSNGPDKDYVFNPFSQSLAKVASAYLAAPYFTLARPLLEAARRGCAIQAIIGLNPATDPSAVAQIVNVPNLSVRYFTHRFHAKLYIFGSEGVLLGSSNLTDGGMYSNREAVISLDASVDGEAVEEARALFAELWEAAQILTPDKLLSFKLAWTAIDRKGPAPEAFIEQAVGRSEPVNINVASRRRSSEQIFHKELRKQVYEQYRPAFLEVSSVLDRQGHRRRDFADFGLAVETNRFLNWVRLVHAPGDEAWQGAPLRAALERQAEVRRLGAIWSETDDDKVPGEYFDRLSDVGRAFGTSEAIASSSMDELTQGLLGVHAFLEQSRFVKGGESKLPVAFWTANGRDEAKIRRSLTYLLHGPSDFIERLHDLLYARERKLGHFGYFCALELFGTVKPEVCPPLNGRTAKALRFLGYDVRPS